MSNPMNTRPNTQMSAIKIPDYCLLEIYKDTISSNTAIGYSILPLKGLNTTAAIKRAIRRHIITSAPAGYSELAILAGRQTESFNHRKVYCVWYNQGNIPTYPEEPTIPVLPTPTDKLNIWHTISLINSGSAPCFCDIVINGIPGDNFIELTLNGHLFKIDVSQEPNNFILRINKNGIFINNVLTDKFITADLPVLISGVNTIKVKKTNTTNINITYTPQY